MKRLWQSWMIALARSPRVTRWMQGNRATASIARRFVAGADAMQAMTVARDLERAGFKASLYYLGEYVKDPAIVAENGREKIAVAESPSAAHLQIHVSLDSTQIGTRSMRRRGRIWRTRSARASATWPARTARRRC
jgi:proline dehydrogenase